MEVIPVILAGGSGKRLWPLSRQMHPKQFLNLFNDRSLLQNTIERINKIENLSQDLVVVCNENHKYTVSNQLNIFKELRHSIIVEPESKNTAAATFAAAKHVTQKRDAREIIILVFPSDHMIGDLKEFCRSINAAIKSAYDGKLVALGVEPFEPNTNYGYIKPESKEKAKTSRIESFVEKPNFEAAKEFLSKKAYLWNSGMFIFRADLFMEEMSLHAKKITKFAGASYKESKVENNFISLNQDSFSKCPSLSLDHALMEKTEKAFVFPLNADWSDIGNLKSYLQTKEQDDSGNHYYGDLISVDSNDSFVYSKDKLTTLLGVENLTIINTKDSLLVADNESLKNLDQITDKLELLDRSEYKLSNKVYRPWGWYETLESGETFQIKRICVLPSKSISLQKHNHRSEHWTLVKGTAQVTLGDEILNLKEDQSVYIPKGEIHRIENLGKDDIEFIEVQYGSYLEEDDIERFEDMFGRT